MLTLGTVGAVLYERATISGSVAAVLTGLIAGAAVRLALGSSAGRPSLEDIAAGLEALDVPAHDLQEVDRQVAGVLLVYAKDSSGGDLAIKVYGRDAYDNQMLARAWRALVVPRPGIGGALARPAPRSARPSSRCSPHNAGAPVSEVLTAGITAGGDTLIVLRASGRLLGTFAADEVGDELLAAAGRHSIGSRRPASPIARSVPGRSASRTARSRSSISAGASSRPTTTSASPTARSCWQPPQASSVRSARSRRPWPRSAREEVSALLPYLQQAAFAGPLRKAVKAAEIDVDDLRKAAAEAADTPVPELVRISRVTWGTLVQVGLLMFAGAAVLSFVGVSTSPI